MPTKPVIVIEHLEPEISPWLLLEYRHCSKIYGKDFLFITNLPTKYHKLLGKYANVLEKSVKALISENVLEKEATIILDPRSSVKLDFSTLNSAKYVIVGGILGEHPPKGRTYELITKELKGVKSFNIGDGQFSIDGTVYYINHLLNNKTDEGLSFVDGVTIEYFEPVYFSVNLPFRYPLENGEPVIAPGLKYYLQYRRLPEEVWREINDP
ncbi:MAG: hypothetical protein ACO2OS_03855 [Thermosphaera aggregans]|jgi:ribosome biogenesis SPOUT family RNA methylase Rps3|uniref:hypothetical protein n=1 Tax=Thermosphaera aggregans TaxID=54254 RepID=UPI003C03D80B